MRSSSIYLLIWFRKILQDAIPDDIQTPEKAIRAPRPQKKLFTAEDVTQREQGKVSSFAVNETNMARIVASVLVVAITNPEDLSLFRASTKLQL